MGPDQYNTLFTLGFGILSDPPNDFTKEVDTQMPWLLGFQHCFSNITAFCGHWIFWSFIASTKLININLTIYSICELFAPYIQRNVRTIYNVITFSAIRCRSIAPHTFQDSLADTGAMTMTMKIIFLSWSYVFIQCTRATAYPTKTLFSLAKKTCMIYNAQEKWL